jgi:O-antigen/teichoic acid export membrane protein
VKKIQDNQSYSEKVVKNTIWNSAGVVVYFACQWMITIIVVWLSEDYLNAGYLALAMNVTNVFCTVALYNTRAFQVSDIKSEYNDSSYVAARILTCAGSIALCAVFLCITDLTQAQRVIVLCYMVFRANDAFIDVLHGIVQKEWKMSYISVSLIARGIAMLAAFALFLWLFDLLSAVIAMAVVTILIGLIYDLPKAKKLARFTAYTGAMVLSLLKRCFPLMLVILFGTLIVSFSRYSIERIHGTEALGIYTSATVPAMVVQIAVATLLAPLIGVFADVLKERDKKKFIRIFIMTSAVIVVITAVFAVASHFLGEWGLNLLYDDSILPYTYLLPEAVVVAGLTASLWFMNYVFSATRDLKGILAGNIFGMIICFAGTDFFLVRYDLAGANHIMNISQGAALLFLIVRFICKNRKGLDVD